MNSLICITIISTIDFAIILETLVGVGGGMLVTTAPSLLKGCYRILLRLPCCMPTARGARHGPLLLVLWLT
jgi:hypothetical protein